MPKRKPEPRSTGPPPRRFGVRNFLDTLPWCDACGTWVRKHGHWDANGDCVSVKFHRSFDARVAALKGGTVGKGKHKGKAAVQAPVKAPPPPPPAAPVKRRRGTAATPAAPPLALWHVGVVLAEWGKADWVERLSKRLRDEARDEAMRLGHTLPRFSLDSATGAYTGAFEARCAGCMKLAIVNTVRYVATGQGWGGGVFKGECPNPGAAIPVTGETVGGQPATPAPRSAAVAGAAPTTRAPRAPRQRGVPGRCGAAPWHRACTDQGGGAGQGRHRQCGAAGGAAQDSQPEPHPQATGGTGAQSQTVTGTRRWQARDAGLAAPAAHPEGGELVGKETASAPSA